MALMEGVIPAGAALPSETELMNHFQVSRNTVRRALGQLETEKRIIRRRGSGSYARSFSGPVLTPALVGEVIRDGAAAKANTSSRLLRVHSGPTPEFVQRRDPQFGESSMMVQRTRSYKEEPFLLTTSFVPEVLARRLTRRLLAQNTVLVALDGLGVRPVSAEQTVTAVIADSVAVRHLGVEPASALLCIHRLIRDGEGRSIEHQSHLYRPDRYHMQSRAAIERAAEGLQWMGFQAPPVPAWL
jgi:GntR family transcriptional regulator